MDKFEKASQLVSNQMKSNSRFREFCLAVQAEPAARGQGLESILIMPVQR